MKENYAMTTLPFNGHAVRHRARILPADRGRLGAIHAGGRKPGRLSQSRPAGDADGICAGVVLAGVTYDSCRAGDPSNGARVEPCNAKLMSLPLLSAAL